MERSLSFRKKCLISVRGFLSEFLKVNFIQVAISESRIKQRLFRHQVLDMQLFLHILAAVPSDNTFLKVYKRNKREIKKDTTCWKMVFSHEQNQY